MQPTDVDYLKMHEFTSSIAINMLTLNRGNLTRNPKLDNREVYNMPMKDRPIVKMMMQNSAHILCLNGADAFFSPNDEKSRELIKTFIRFGYKGIVIKQWSSRPIACFVRGGPSARVELLARHISDAKKSANTYSKLQHVFNPANGLVNILMRAYQRLWNETKDLPLVDRMEYVMETSYTLKSIVRHHLYMKCGSGYDRTFPDVMMTFVFGWGKTNVQQAFRKDEMNGMDDEQLELMRNPTKAIFDYQVSSAERFKHVNNDMFMNGSQDSDSHSPLMVYIRSKSATRQRNSERYQEYIKKKQAWTPQEYKDYNKQWGHQKQWKDYSTSPWNGYVDYGQQPPMVSSIRLTMKIHTFSTTNSIQMIDPRRLQDYTMSERSVVSPSSRVYIALYITL